MKRFILSAFSLLIATGAIAPTAQALPKIEPEFNLQTLRLNQFDVRNKSEESQPSYTYLQESSPTVLTEQDSNQTTEPTVWEKPENQEDISSPALSLTEQRHESLDRS